MKKLLLVLLSALMLCGCEKSSEYIPKTQNLQFTVTVENTEYDFTVTSDQDSNLSINVNAPESIENLKLEFCEEMVMLNYLELKKELPVKSLERESAFLVVYEGFKAANNTERLNLKDNEYFIEYRIGNNKYRFLFGETGLPLKIEGINQITVIIFKGVTILN